MSITTLLAACTKEAKPRDESTALQFTPISLLTSYIGGGAAPVFAEATSGQLTAAWVSAPQGGTDGRLYIAPEAGATSVYTLRDTLGSLSIYGEVPPKIAYGPDRTLYTAYLVTKSVPGKKWPVNALRFAYSSDAGAHWSDPVTVTGNSVFGSYDDHALHVTMDGTIYLTWLAMRDSSHTYISRSIDQGRTWSTPTVIDTHASCPCCRTAMTSSADGTLYVAWRKIFRGGTNASEIRDVVVARSTDHGVTWSAPVRVHEDNWHVTYCPDAGPSVKVGRDGTLHVAWWTGKEGAAGVRYTQSHDGGRSFSSPIELGVAPHSRASHVQLALDDQQPTVVAAAWDDGTRQTPQIVFRISHNGGATFTPTQVLSEPAYLAGYPVLAIHGDSVHVAWQQRTPGSATHDSMTHMVDVHKRGVAMAHIAPLGSLQVAMRIGVLR